MVSKEAIQRQLDRVKSESDLGLAIELMADAVADAEALDTREQASLKGQITMLREIIVGNGKPSASLVARIERLEEDSEKWGAKIDEVHKTLLGDLPEGSKTSLLNRVEEVEKVANIIKKLTWLIVSLVVGDVFVRIAVQFFIK